MAHGATRWIFLTASVWALLLAGVFSPAELFAGLSAAGVVPAKPARITVVDDAAYPPFAFLDADGRPAGEQLDVVVQVRPEPPGAGDHHLGRDVGREREMPAQRAGQLCVRPRKARVVL